MASTKLYTTTEAAHLLGIDASRVRHKILDGELKATRYGRRVLLIRADDLDAYRRGKPARLGRPRNTPPSDA